MSAVMSIHEHDALLDAHFAEQTKRSWQREVEKLATAYQDFPLHFSGPVARRDARNMQREVALRVRTDMCHHISRREVSRNILLIDRANATGNYTSSDVTVLVRVRRGHATHVLVLWCVDYGGNFPTQRGAFSTTYGALAAAHCRARHVTLPEHFGGGDMPWHEWWQDCVQMNNDADAVEEARLTGRYAGFFPCDNVVPEWFTDDNDETK